MHHEVDATIERIQWWQAVLERARRVQATRKNQKTMGKISKTPSLRKRVSTEEAYNFR